HPCPKVVRRVPARHQVPDLLQRRAGRERVEFEFLPKQRGEQAEASPEEREYLRGRLGQHQRPFVAPLRVPEDGGQSIRRHGRFLLRRLDWYDLARRRLAALPVVTTGDDVIRV